MGHHAPVGTWSKPVVSRGRRGGQREILLPPPLGTYKFCGSSPQTPAQPYLAIGGITAGCGPVDPGALPVPRGAEESDEEDYAAASWCT